MSKCWWMKDLHAVDSVHLSLPVWKEKKKTGRCPDQERLAVKRFAAATDLPLPGSPDMWRTWFLLEESQSQKILFLGIQSQLL